MYRSTVGHGRQFGNHHCGNPKSIGCTTDFQSGHPMAVREHVHPDAPSVARTQIRAVGHAAGRSQWAAGSAGAEAARARSPPRSGPSRLGPARRVPVTVRGMAPTPLHRRRAGGLRPPARRIAQAPPPRPLKEEIMKTPHCTSATTHLEMPCWTSWTEVVP
jgi:hypothetical protein